MLKKNGVELPVQALKQLKIIFIQRRLGLIEIFREDPSQGIVEVGRDLFHDKRFERGTAAVDLADLFRGKNVHAVATSPLRVQRTIVRELSQSLTNRSPTDPKLRGALRIFQALACFELTGNQLIPNPFVDLRMQRLCVLELDFCH